MGYSNKWNQSGGDGVNPSPRSARPSWTRGLVAGALVVLLGLVAWLWLSQMSGDAANDVESQAQKSRQSVKSKSSTAVAKDKVETAVVGIPAQTVASEPKTNQWGNPAHWGHKKLRPSAVHRLDRSTLPLYEQLFDNGADRAIAGLLVIEPGMDLIGDDVFGEEFVRSFRRSIESPIIISKDDSEDAKALKRALIETKIDLKNRLDAGEDIAKTLTDIRRELRELGAYREDLKKYLEDLSHDGKVTAQEMKDFVEAANLMLDERGAKRIVLPEFYYRQINLRNQRRNAVNKE